MERCRRDNAHHLIERRVRILAIGVTMHVHVSNHAHASPRCIHEGDHSPYAIVSVGGSLGAWPTPGVEKSVCALAGLAPAARDRSDRLMRHPFQESPSIGALEAICTSREISDKSPETPKESAAVRPGITFACILQPRPCGCKPFSSGRDFQDVRIITGVVVDYDSGPEALKR